ncbi:MAG: SAM-dependent methyltransferase [Clostridia bacterium]|nr:SAM-dependent methyltransferase [Clostridia bacterium]
MKNILDNLNSNQNKIVKIILSDSNIDIKKIVVRPIIIKSNIKWQIEKFIGAQVFHANVEYQEILNLPFDSFKQITIEKEGSTTIFSKKKQSYSEKTVNNNIKLDIKAHDKIKNYIIKEGEYIPALVELGIFNKEGKIIKGMNDKFKQINKFIEIIDDAYKTIIQKEITILDFGCGKSYLTFLLYHYFTKIKDIKANIIGYDIKKDVVSNCNKIAQKYGYDGLKFVLSDVKKDELYQGKIDMIVTLHACDTATDFALDFAIKNKVPLIFSVPCCQHEINLSIKKGGDFDILLEDGLIKERFSALLTDSIRAEVLRAKGYSVDIIEFVDFAHSPKNLMIRAKLNSKKKSLDRVTNLVEKYKFSQKLYELQKD